MQKRGYRSTFDVVVYFRGKRNEVPAAMSGRDVDDFLGASFPTSISVIRLGKWHSGGLRTSLF